VAEGALKVTTCAVHPVAVAVIATLVPNGMPVIAVAPTVPALAVTTAPFGLLILMLYVVPLQIPALKLTPGVAHAVLQSAGWFTIMLVLHEPVVLVAVIVTLLPIGILIIVLPLTVPALAVTLAPALTLNATLYVPVPVHTPWPADNVGVIQPGVGVQLVGDTAVAVVVAHPFTDEAVNTTLVPTGIPVTILPLTVPALAVTIPLLVNITL